MCYHLISSSSSLPFLPSPAQFTSQVHLHMSSPSPSPVYSQINLSYVLLAELLISGIRPGKSIVEQIESCLPRPWATCTLDLTSAWCAADGQAFWKPCRPSFMPILRGAPKKFMDRPGPGLLAPEVPS